ncbi:DUF1642 domain-containing protein [Lactococcus cremoris]
MTKFELPEKPKKTNTSEDFNNLRKAVDELDKFDYAWKTYANKADRRINAANKYIEELERENQRLIAEDLDVKTLVDNAKPQQALPVVPECVGKELYNIDFNYWIENKMRLACFTARTLNWLEQHRGDWNIEYYICKLRFGGFTVEKPQLFYLKNKITGMYLSSDGKELYEHHKNHGFKFTKEDINSLETGSYELVPVEDGE